MIDYDDEAVVKLADSLFGQAQNELDFIRKSYEFVRDRIAHFLIKILKILKKCGTRTELWESLPTELSYL